MKCVGRGNRTAQQFKHESYKIEEDNDGIRYKYNIKFGFMFNT